MIQEFIFSCPLLTTDAGTHSTHTFLLSTKNKLPPFILFGCPNDTQVYQLTPVVLVLAPENVLLWSMVGLLWTTRVSVASKPSSYVQLSMARVDGTNHC